MFIWFLLLFIWLVISDPTAVTATTTIATFSDTMCIDFLAVQDGVDDGNCGILAGVYSVNNTFVDPSCAVTVYSDVDCSFNAKLAPPGQCLSNTALHAFDNSSIQSYSVDCQFPSKTSQLGASVASVQSITSILSTSSPTSMSQGVSISATTSIPFISITSSVSSVSSGPGTSSVTSMFPGSQISSADYIFSASANISGTSTSLESSMFSTKLITTTFAASSTAAASSSEPRLSTALEVGIGIATGVCALLVIVCGWFISKGMRRRRVAHVFHELDEISTAKHELETKNVEHELDASSSGKREQKHSLDLVRVGRVLSEPVQVHELPGCPIPTKSIGVAF
ncbi:hypothetical protein MMC17_008196 [Xylographa soralifera]|nr:hypothetical protein [Xylographa soralifera]